MACQNPAQEILALAMLYHSSCWTSSSAQAAHRISAGSMDWIQARASIE